MITVILFFAQKTIFYAFGQSVAQPAVAVPGDNRTSSPLSPDDTRKAPP
jgi:hypothetical protein